MRIGIDYTPALRQRAGVGRYTRGLVRALAAIDQRNEYVLLAAAGGLEMAAERPLPGDNFRERRIPLSDHFLTILWHRLRLPLPVEFLIGRIDVFHSTDFVLPPLWHGHSLVTVHDLSFIRHPECADRDLREYLCQVVPRSVRRADIVLADSQSTKRDIVELLGVDPAKVRVVYAGVDDRFIPIEEEEKQREVRDKYRLDFPFVLNLSTLEPRKNQVRLIEAYGLLSERKAIPQRLVLAGGKGWLYKGIFRRVEELKLTDRVYFPGFIPEEDLPTLYSLADVFVFPSLYEGFGLPPLEAMACGTPVVASDVASLPEMIEEAGILVPPDDVEALASAIELLLEDEDLRKDLIAKGLLRARSFSWERAAEGLLEIYEAFS